MNDAFFIGYNPQSGKGFRRTLRPAVLLILLVAAAICLAFARLQQPFANSAFEMGRETELSGTYFEAPYPILRVPLGGGAFKDVLLLGFGKRGVNPYLDDLRRANKSLGGRGMTLTGNLIYYNGKTLLQVTGSEKIRLDGWGIQKPREKESVGAIQLTGEIVDPKCYFGVMKPGFGKIHRSCAVLCISGGIPPVFVSQDSAGRAQYYLLTGTEGQPLNSEILDLIGKPSRLHGQVESAGDWQYLRVNPEHIAPTGAASNIFNIH